MLKNLHVITGIIFALTIFCLLQVVTGGLFYSAVSNDRHNFQNSGVLNAQQESLSDSVNTLVKTRVTVTRVAIRYLKNQRDPASLAAINKLLGTAVTRWLKPKPITKRGRNCRRLTARMRR
jgi:methyl-accepting chemotaxis protein